MVSNIHTGTHWLFTKANYVELWYYFVINRNILNNQTACDLKRNDAYVTQQEWKSILDNSNATRISMPYSASIVNVYAWENNKHISSESVYLQHNTET